MCAQRFAIFFSYIACAQDFSFSEEDEIFTFWVRERRYNARFFDGNCGGKSPIAVEVVKVYCFRTTGFFFFFFFLSRVSQGEFSDVAQSGTRRAMHCAPCMCIIYYGF